MHLEFSGEVWSWRGPAPYHLCTALWPKDGRYVVPLKDKVRQAEGIELGMIVNLGLAVQV